MLSNESCLVVFYHYVRDVERTAFPAIKALAVADFLNQVDALQASRSIIDYPTLQAWLDSGAPPSSASALLTFDDGFAEHYSTVYPALRKRGVSGIFFIAGATLTTPPQLLAVHRTHFLLAHLGSRAFAGELQKHLDQVSTQLSDRLNAVYCYDAELDSSTKQLLNYELPFDKADRILETLFREHLGDPSEFAESLYLSHKMIREMAEGGMTFGFHTQNHRLLSRLTVDEQRAEIAHGVTLIRELTGQASVPFSYPYGRGHTYNAETTSILRDAGYSMAFTTARRPLNPVKDARFELPRYDTRDLPLTTGETIDA